MGQKYATQSDDWKAAGKTPQRATKSTNNAYRVCFLVTIILSTVKLIVFGWVEGDDAYSASGSELGLDDGYERRVRRGL